MAIPEIRAKLTSIVETIEQTGVYNLDVLHDELIQVNLELSTLAQINDASGDLGKSLHNLAVSTIVISRLAHDIPTCYQVVRLANKIEQLSLAVEMGTAL